MQNPEKHQILEANLAFMKPAAVPSEIFRANKAVISINSPIKLPRTKKPLIEAQKIMREVEEVSSEKQQEIFHLRMCESKPTKPRTVFSAIKGFAPSEATTCMPKQLDLT